MRQGPAEAGLQHELFRCARVVVADPGLRDALAARLAPEGLPSGVAPGTCLTRPPSGRVQGRVGAGQRPMHGAKKCLSPP